MVIFSARYHFPALIGKTDREMSGLFGRRLDYLKDFLMPTRQLNNKISNRMARIATQKFFDHGRG